MVVGPVLVTVEAPRTAKFTAEPSGLVLADAMDGLRRNAANGMIRTIRAAHL
jgi:hypothetical protein